MVAKLADAEVLLVLDNCEHLLDGGRHPGRAAAGRRVPRVAVLATSRARLRVPFEFVFPVPGLSLEGATTVRGASDAGGLFRERGGDDRLVVAVRRRPPA